ncbi:Elongation of very long chain fatty acids protein 4 [Amphibalanus amphitrite]|uniref:Elongation of very long chain fatty acids protein n=1 Tax=Amphibalanus amphitrite TaxID=1232801 RepID=A0A6A4V4E0_AMPAM|nr:elongation of very long chain fatty acids protein 7-like [Amphibalanus amphitrite]KAF0290129.1 Elongation of very long chain fatty acids protein 4 [Amphibalanus amphitrite]KAF0291157.1 Elongation of very long chain fatty acids protein 4 [Amphibalanus amphitrite]
MALETVRDITAGLWQRRDPRVRHQLLQASPSLVLAVLAAYLLLVRYGPRLMKNRQTPNLTLAMAAYNVLQVTLSAYMMREFIVSRPQRVICAVVDVSENPVSKRLADACWLFHISKAVDFLDTVFLVLKKDNKRLTYLHVFHHASMFFSYYIATLFSPGGASWLGCALNCFVHCVMYGYYFLAALGPAVRRHLWWKRYLTQLQMIQFSIILLHIISMRLPGLRCGAPLWAGAMTFVYLLVLTGLFLNFYMRSYRGDAKRQSGEPKPRAASTEVTTSTPVKKQKHLPLIWRMLQTHGLGCFHQND